MVYSDFAIDQLLRRLAEAWNRTSTPRRLAGDLLEAIEVIRQLRTKAVPPPNPPLTLEELRELEGEPVWIRNYRTGAYTCRVIDSSDANFTHFTDGGLLENRSYDLYWTTYRRRPEEVTQ